MNIGYVSCKDTNAVVFLIAQITFLEAHLGCHAVEILSGGGKWRNPFFSHLALLLYFRSLLLPLIPG